MTPCQTCDDYWPIIGRPCKGCGKGGSIRSHVCKICKEQFYPTGKLKMCRDCAVKTVERFETKKRFLIAQIVALILIIIALLFAEQAMLNKADGQALTPEQRIAEIASDWLTPQLIFKIYMTRGGKEELVDTQVFGPGPVTIWSTMRGDTKFHCEAHANIVNLDDLFSNEE